MRAEENLKILKIKLPMPPSPLGAYLPARKTGNLLFISGALPTIGGKLLFKGKLGKGINTKEGYEAAHIACLNSLSIIKSELGSLDKVRRIIKVTGYVASSPNYHNHSKVVNGASELLLKVFGDQGKHSRAAVGCSSLPSNSPVEIEMVVEFK
jgi:enamine deaminase RidA (YjgF/YER057c/UK114 family)